MNLGRLLPLYRKVTALQSFATNPTNIFVHRIPSGALFQAHHLKLYTSTAKNKFYNPFHNRNKHIKPLKQLVSIDLECTCDSPVQIYPMEIIELACIKVDLANLTSHEEPFHEYVRPVVNPQLTLFCTDLTGILQSVLDESDDISVVVKRLLQWMNKQNLISDDYQEKKEQFSFVSCGNYDMNCLQPALNKYYESQGKETPDFFKEWINIKKPFVQITHQWPRGLYHMLEILEESATGNLHSAIDDCKNLAKVIQVLDKRGCEFFITSRLNEQTAKSHKILKEQK